MRKLAIFAFSFAAAVAVFVYLLSASVGLILGAVFLAAGIALCFFRTTTIKRIRIAVFGLAIGMLWGCFHEHTKIAPLMEHCGQRQEITAQIVDVPEATQWGCSVTADLDGGRIRLYLNSEAETLSLGDWITVTADVSNVLYSSETEYDLYYQSHDISLIGIQKGNLMITQTGRLPLRLWPRAAAAVVREKLGFVFPEDVGGFAAALILGEKDGMSYQLRNALSIAGISHVVAVSGLHISILLSVLTMLIRKRKRLMAIVAIPAIWLFAALVGFTPSVTRAAVMQTFLLMAPVFYREYDMPTALGSALLLILLENPWAVANISLQLSFGAVAGIVLFVRRLSNWLMLQLVPASKNKKSRLRRLWKRVASAVSANLAMSLSAQVFTVPLVAVYFGQVSLISPLTNLLLLWLINLCFILCLLCVLLGLIYPPAGAALAWLTAWPLRLILRGASALAEVPNAAVYTDSFYVIAWLVALFVFLTVFLLCKRRRPLFLIAGLVISLAGALLFSSLNTAALTAKVLDVGQGQCILLRSGSMTALVDCGGDQGDADGEKAARVLLAEGISSVDVLVLTHYDEDHTCGLAQFLSRITVGQILAPDIYDDAGKRETVLSLAAQYGVPVQLVTEDLDVNFSGGVLRIFAPVDSESENVGLCALLSVQDYDILITGDMDLAGESALLQSHSLPDIELLVAGHHGSKYATSEALLTATMPETVVISVGDNHFGHPTQEVLDRAAAIGAVVYRTDLDGDITITR